MTSGVPQGSHLGPLLFLIFINDLPGIIRHSEILLYADDVKLFLSFKHESERRMLQNDISAFSDWCDINLMVLNIDKCKCMTFSRKTVDTANYNIKSVALSNVHSCLDLGVMMDAKLNFNSHISMIVNKAYRNLGFIKRWAKDLKDPYVTKLLFISLVRPIVEYASVVWTPQYNIYSNMIESVQKQFLLFALRQTYCNSGFSLPSYEMRLKLINLPTLLSRRKMLNALFVLKILSGDVYSPTLLGMINLNVPCRNLRRSDLIKLSCETTNYGVHSPFRCACNDLNCLYSIIDFQCSYNTVKKNIIISLNT